MQTVFDFDPSGSELETIGFDAITLLLRHGLKVKEPVTESNYKVHQDSAYFDIALLLTHRQQEQEAAEFWEKIPSRYEEYLHGFDDTAIT